MDNNDSALFLKFLAKIGKIGLSLAFVNLSSMQRQTERSLAEILQEVIHIMKWTDRIHDERILSAWGKVVGKTMSSYTKKLYIRKRVLYVEIDSSPLRLELHYLKEKVRLALNTALGEDYLLDIIIR